MKGVNTNDATNVAQSVNEPNAVSRRKLKELNHSVTVLCPFKHLVENVTLGMIKHRFPEVKAIPNNTYILDFSDICADCVAHNEKIAEKKARQSEKTESFKAKRAEEKLEKLENIKENLMARFRPDQETRVTLHNVHFLLDGELCKTSFYGKVTHRSVQVKSDGIDVDLHVEIFPRKDLSFKKIGIVSNYTSGLSISLHKKSKRFQVCLKYNQLLRDSEYCRLGSKCGKRCAEQPKEESDGGCWEHTLRAVEKVPMVEGASLIPVAKTK